MSITDFAQSSKVESYRIGTGSRDKCPGITIPSFRCVCCKKTKASAGRKQVIKGAPKFGYKCADCVRAGK